MKCADRQRGQAGAELLALVPALLLLGLICWQILAAAATWLNAAGAARVGARAAAVGDLPREAVGRVVRMDGPQGARLIELKDGEAGPRVRVSIPAPRPAGGPSLGWLRAEAEAGQ